MECTVWKAQTGIALKPSGAKNPLRVAAYCRVSTDRVQQLTSLEAQTEVFTRRILTHPGWELAGIYADEGLSATSTAKRAAFQRMMQDAKDGKIDYIITKSLSRFARNTLDCLTCIRQLQGWGVNLLFEKENIDTGTALSEMLLTVLAAFAQEESRSISENIKWGLRKGYANGQVRWQQLYGYRKGRTSGKSCDAEWLIEPDEAKVVRTLFDRYEHGESLADILKTLKNTPSPNGKGKWTVHAIWNVLTNEKYVGDVCTQKYITQDHLSHKAVRNAAGNVPSYYLRDHHTPIVSRKTFERVQKIRAMRNNKQGGMQYPYGAVSLQCPCCGQQLIQRQMRTSSEKLLWCCFGDHGCRGYAVKTWQLNAAVLDAWRNHSDQPVPETVEYWWLDEYAEKIQPTQDHRITVHWKDGSSSEGIIPVQAWQHEPARILECYRRYIEDLEHGRRDGRFPVTPEEKQRAKDSGREIPPHKTEEQASETERREDICDAGSQN